MPPKSVLLVDDNPQFLAFARRFVRLQGPERFHILPEAASRREAENLADAHRPDFILMDLAMADGGGLEATRYIRPRHPNTQIIALTIHDVDEYRRAALQAGADHFIIKSEIYEQLPPILLA